MRPSDTSAWPPLAASCMKCSLLGAGRAMSRVPVSPAWARTTKATATRLTVSRYVRSDRRSHPPAGGASAPPPPGTQPGGCAVHDGSCGRLLAPPLSPAESVDLESGTRVASGRDEPMAFFGFLLACFLFCRLNRRFREYRAAVGEDGGTYMTWDHD